MSLVGVGGVTVAGTIIGGGGGGGAALEVIFGNGVD